MPKTLELPEFSSEREEAEWWDANPDFFFAQFEEAVANGTLHRSGEITTDIRALAEKILTEDRDADALADPPIVTTGATPILARR